VSNDERARLLSQALYSIGPEQFPFKDTRFFPFYLENREQTKTASRANVIKLFLGCNLRKYLRSLGQHLKRKLRFKRFITVASAGSAWMSCIAQSYKTFFPAIS